MLESPRLWSITWEVPEWVSFTKLHHSPVDHRVSSSSCLYVQESIFIFVPSYSLYQHRLAYVLYESWLCGICRVYTPSSLGHQKFAVNPLQNSSDLDSRVVYIYIYAEYTM